MVFFSTSNASDNFFKQEIDSIARQLESEKNLQQAAMDTAIAGCSPSLRSIELKKIAAHHSAAAQIAAARNHRARILRTQVAPVTVKICIGIGAAIWLKQIANTAPGSLRSMLTLIANYGAYTATLVFFANGLTVYLDSVDRHQQRHVLTEGLEQLRTTLHKRQAISKDGIDDYQRRYILVKRLEKLRATLSMPVAKSELSPAQAIDLFTQIDRLLAEFLQHGLVAKQDFSEVDSLPVLDLPTRSSHVLNTPSESIFAETTKSLIRISRL